MTSRERPTLRSVIGREGMRGERQNKHWLKRRHRRRTHLCSALQYSSCDASSDGELFAFDSKKRSVSALGRDVSQSAARPTIEKLKRGVVVRDRSATETADATRGNADEVARRRNMRCAINVLANLFFAPFGVSTLFCIAMSSSPSFIHKVTNVFVLDFFPSRSPYSPWSGRCCHCRCRAVFRDGHRETLCEIFRDHE
jgi:hypothetical protein